MIVYLVEARTINKRDIIDITSTEDMLVLLRKFNTSTIIDLDSVEREDLSR
jgi:hypothetical protein